jgi:hypothetical protein
MGGGSDIGPFNSKRERDDDGRWGGGEAGWQASDPESALKVADSDLGLNQNEPPQSRLARKKMGPRRRAEAKGGWRYLD